MRHISRKVTWGIAALAAVVATLGLTQRAETHCQVPCGIYDDAGRIAMIREDVTTISKAITQIGELAGSAEPKSANQLARWVTTKEQHASHIITVVAEYFLTQKVKPVAADADGYPEYLTHLAAHHAVMVAAMKAKQDASPATVTALNAAIDELANHYH